MSIISLAVNPPDILNPFDGVPDSCVLTVPCGSHYDYYCSSWGTCFEIINEDCGDVGIADLETSEASVYAVSGGIIVVGAPSMQVRVYDMLGRMVATRCGADGQVRMAVPAAGVYLVKVGAAPARRVVVAR